MRGFWRARQKSVGCISSHAWKLPLVMAVCILAYSLPLSLAVSLEPLTEPQSTPDDSPNNQLVAPPDGNRSTFDVTYLGALTDKWLGWAPLQNMLSVCNKRSTQPPLPLLPPLILLGQFVVSLLVMMFAGNVNPGPRTMCISTVQFLLLAIVRVDGAPHDEWRRQQPDEINTTTTSDTTGTPGGLSDATRIGIGTTVSLLGIIVGAVVTIWGIRYANKKKNKITPTGDDCIATYVRSLKSTYSQRKIGDGKRWKGRPTSPRYINLTVVRQHNIDKSDGWKSTKMRGNIGNILTKKKESLELKELDQLEDGSKAKCVLVQGAPGVGKTTMAQELCRQWAEEKLFKHYSLLVLLKLRNKSVQSIKEKKDLFLRSSDPSAVASIVEKRIEKETAFLLDGFDELPQEMQTNSIFVDLIKKDVFPDACVIITSRPSAIDTLCNHCSGQTNQHIEVLGFTEEQRDKFVKAWFDDDKSVEESSREDEQHQFEKYLDFHPHIRALMYIPLSCSIVLSVYQSSSKTRNNAPKTQTELYTHNTLAILSKYLDKRDGKETWKLKRMQDIPDKEQKKLKKLSELAYSGIVHQPDQQLIFQEWEIPQDLIEDKEAMGFLEVEEDMFGPDSYNFLHLTIQEFLAAYYISTLKASEQLQPSAEQEQKIEDSIGKRHLEIMLRFYAGLSCIQQGSVASRTLTDWLQTHYDSDPGRRLEYLHWMFEAQDQGLIRQVLGNGTQDLDLSGQTLDPFDCYVLGYCIAKSDCQWKLECKLKEEGMKMLSRGSEGCLRNVRVIKFYGSDLKVGVEHLASALKKNTSLTKLSLVECHIDAEGASHLEQALRVNTTLRVLNLSHNIAIGSQGAEHLASALREKTVLTKLKLWGCGIDAEGTSHLEQALCVNTTLRVLNLGGNTIDSQGAGHLASALRENTVLTELRLRRCHIDAEGLSHLAQALCVNTTLSVLSLSENTVDSQGAGHLASALRENTVLTELILLGCHIDAEGTSHLVQALRVNTTLRVLDLSENTVGSQGARHLASALRENTGLTELRLEDCHIDAEGTSHLVQALRVNTTLRVLNLRGNTVDSQGAEHLASALRGNTGLTELRLEDCHIDAEGTSHLVQALRVNTTLRVLNLRGNTVDSQGAGHLASALRENTVLTELILWGCDIDAEGTSHLVQALRDNTTLRVLDLNGNTVGSKGAEHLALVLEKTRSLTELDLWQCDIGEDGACQLARAIRANSTLKKLDLRDNPLKEEGAKELVESLAHNTTIKELHLPQQYKDTTSNSVVKYDKFSKRVHWE